MKITYVNFPAIINDNDMLYYNNLGAFVESIDTRSILRITKNLQGINIRISPSHPRYLEILIAEMKRFHTMFGITLQFSKSMKKSYNICFDIVF